MRYCAITGRLTGTSGQLGHTDRVVEANLSHTPTCMLADHKSFDCGSNYVVQGVQIQANTCHKNLGVLVFSSLKRRWHTEGNVRPFKAHLASSANCLVGFPSKPAKYCTTPHEISGLGYDRPASFLCASGELVKLERVQRAVTRLITGMRAFSYERRLQVTGPFPAPHRGNYGDPIYTKAGPLPPGSVPGLMWYDSTNCLVQSLF